MFLISEASSLIIFLEVTEKKLAWSHHVQSGWVIISSPFISGRGSAPLSFHSAEQWGQGRPRGLGAPGLPRSLSRARRLEVAPGWSAGGAPTSPQLGDRELRCMWGKSGRSQRSPGLPSSPAPSASRRVSSRGRWGHRPPDPWTLPPGRLAENSRHSPRPPPFLANLLALSMAAWLVAGSGQVVRPRGPECGPPSLFQPVVCPGPRVWP